MQRCRLIANWTFVAVLVVSCTSAISLCQSTGEAPVDTSHQKAVALGGDAATEDYIAAQGELAASEAPAEIAPRLVFQLARQLASCSREHAFKLYLRAFDAALLLSNFHDEKVVARQKTSAIEDAIRLTQREVYVGVVEGLLDSGTSLNDDDKPGFVEALISRIAFRTGEITRQDVHLPLLRYLLRRRLDEQERALIAKLQKEDGHFPFSLAAEIVRQNDGSVREEVLRPGWVAIAAGGVTSESDFGYIEDTKTMVPRAIAVKSLQSLIETKRKDSTVNPVNFAIAERAAAILNGIDPTLEREHVSQSLTAPATSSAEDPKVTQYTALQNAAALGASALAEQALKIADPTLRYQMLISSLAEFKRTGNTDAAAAVSKVLAGQQPAGASETNPVDELRMVALTPGADASSVVRALGLAEKILSADAKKYSAAASEEDRLKAYFDGDSQVLSIFAYAAEIDFPRALESAQRVQGPQRSEIMTVLLARTCDPRSHLESSADSGVKNRP